MTPVANFDTAQATLEEPVTAVTETWVERDDAEDSVIIDPEHMEVGQPMIVQLFGQPLVILKEVNGTLEIYGLPPD